MQTLRSFLILLLVAPWSWATAQRAEPADVPVPPPIPSAEERARAQEAGAEQRQAAESDPDQAGREAAPPLEEVIERVEGDQTITEYRRRGQLYMVKVKPKQGPAQYWLDEDGDGRFQERENGINEEINLPKWRIGNW